MNNQSSGGSGRGAGFATQPTNSGSPAFPSLGGSSATSSLFGGNATVPQQATNSANSVFVFGSSGTVANNLRGSGNPGTVIAGKESRPVGFQKPKTLVPTRRGGRASSKEALHFGVRVITINVGIAHKQTFTVHEALICASSKFFHNAMSRPWKEAEDRVVNLPEDDPAIFSLYVQFLYIGVLPTEGAGTPYQEYVKLSKLYVLGEKVSDSQVKNAAVSAMLARYKDKTAEGPSPTPTIDVINIIYNGTCRPCPARQLMVDIYTYRCTSDAMMKVRQYLNSDFVFDLAVGLFDDRTRGSDKVMSRASDHYNELETKTDNANGS